MEPLKSRPIKLLWGCISKQCLCGSSRGFSRPKPRPPADGVIEQMWFKLDARGMVFLVNAESVDVAKNHVHGLPMGQAGPIDFDFIPVGQLAPLGILIAEK